MSTTEEILSDLNDDQREAVLSYGGPCFILAGPGAGKTKTVVSRTQYMIHEGVDASSMMLFTFTNKAAREIRERVRRVIGEEATMLTVGTYHSICVRFLKKYADYIGYDRNFTIFDTDDTKKVLKTILKGYTFDCRRALEYIGRCKDQMMPPAVAMQNATTQLERNLAAVYDAYQKELRTQQAMDFDDLIVNTINLFERNPEVLKEVNARYRHITADEFHDSSPRDIRFIELLAGEDQNICMILDDEQSIYSFRGADIESVLNVGKIFPELKTFVLQRNYRSTKTIVKAARSLIEKNKWQLEKTIFTENEEGTPVIFFAENNQDTEALRVQKLVMLLTRKYGLEYKDIAILYRMSALSRKLEETMLSGNIPYRIIGGTPFYARKEIKDILCYARLVNNPYDFEAFKRVVNEPKRNVGEASFEKIMEYARNNYSMPIGALQACEEIELKGKAAKGLTEFLKTMEELKKIAEEGSACDFINAAILDTGYKKALFETGESGEAEDRFANLMELVELSRSFESISDLLQNTSLDAQIDDNDEDDNKLQMLTMHASKGLEFPAVIIVGANEGICPHQRAAQPKELEEERRLFYVAMTRAEKYLFITRPKMTMQQGRMTFGGESRFVREIDKKYITKY